MSAIQPFKIAPLTIEEEGKMLSYRLFTFTHISCFLAEKLIITRLANDEKILRRLTKTFHTITSLSKPSPPQPTPTNADASTSKTAKTREQLLEDARETFLVDLDQFQMMLMKNEQICDAEARMVEEYDREKERIGIFSLQVDIFATELTPEYSPGTRRLEARDNSAQGHTY